jgi:hypothetical protein
MAVAMIKVYEGSGSGDIRSQQWQQHHAATAAAAATALTTILHRVGTNGNDNDSSVGQMAWQQWQR